MLIWFLMVLMSSRWKRSRTKVADVLHWHLVTSSTCAEKTAICRSEGVLPSFPHGCLERFGIGMVPSSLIRTNLPEDSLFVVAAAPLKVRAACGAKRLDERRRAFMVKATKNVCGGKGFLRSFDWKKSPSVRRAAAAVCFCGVFTGRRHEFLMSLFPTAF
jgi:hypothetical protein